MTFAHEGQIEKKMPASESVQDKVKETDFLAIIAMGFKAYDVYESNLYKQFLQKWHEEEAERQKVEKVEKTVSFSEELEHAENDKDFRKKLVGIWQTINADYFQKLWTHQLTERLSSHGVNTTTQRILDSESAQ